MKSLYPKLYNNSGQVLAVLDNIIKETASIKRVVNGEFTFNFSAYEKELKSEYFDPANALVVDSQTFDIKYIEQEHETDVQYAIQCEHVNYRMEDGEENLFPLYTYTGTPTQILSNILAGTEFSVGTVEFTDAITITVNAEITRKSLIYELANMLGGEVDYTNLGFTINILASIGKNNGFQARFGKNLKGIRKIIDNRGGLKTYYSVDIIMLKNSNEYIEKELRDLEIIDVGDTIQLIDPVIGLDLQNRILSREYNPIFEVNTKLEIANNIELISTKIKQIETSTVHKNKIYNGVHISADEGFVAERSDGKAKSVMNSTEGISIYSDAGDGLERNFFVDLDGRIKAKSIDIDESGTFGGKVKVIDSEKMVMEVFKDVNGGRIKIYDKDGKLNVAIGSEAGTADNIGGTIILFNDSPYDASPQSDPYQRVELGISKDYNSGEINLRKGNGAWIVTLGSDDGNRGFIAVSNGDDWSRITPTSGQINGLEIATQTWASGQFASKNHDHDGDYITASEFLTAMANYALKNHSHSEYATASDVLTAVNNAMANHIAEYHTPEP